jgi:hypothetical protein
MSLDGIHHLDPTYDLDEMRERCDGLMRAMGPVALAKPKRQRKATLARALREMAKAGASVARVEITDEGKFALVLGEPEANKQQGNELDNWLANHAH